MENQQAGAPLQNNVVVVKDPLTFMQLFGGEYLRKYLGGEAWSNVGELYWAEAVDEEDNWVDTLMFTTWNDWETDDVDVNTGDIYWVMERPRMPKVVVEDVL